VSLVGNSQFGFGGSPQLTRVVQPAAFGSGTRRALLPLPITRRAYLALSIARTFLFFFGREFFFFFFRASLPRLCAGRRHTRAMQVCWSGVPDVVQRREPGCR